MNPLALIPYALAAYGGYQGYRGAKDSGASGLGRILVVLTGAYAGYNLGSKLVHRNKQYVSRINGNKKFCCKLYQTIFKESMPGAYNPKSSIANMVDQSGLPPGMRNLLV